MLSLLLELSNTIGNVSESGVWKPQDAVIPSAKDGLLASVQEQHLLYSIRAVDDVVSVITWVTRDVSDAAEQACANHEDDGHEPACAHET